MKASEGCQGRGTEGKEGIEQYVSLEGGWIAQKWVPFPQLYWADTWLQTKEKKKTLVPILLIPPPHTHTHQDWEIKPKRFIGPKIGKGLSRACD